MTDLVCYFVGAANSGQGELTVWGVRCHWGLLRGVGVDRGVNFYRVKRGGKGRVGSRRVFHKNQARYCWCLGREVLGVVSLKRFSCDEVVLILINTVNRGGFIVIRVVL